MTAEDCGSDVKIEVLPLRSDGDHNVIGNCSPAGNGIAGVDVDDGKDRGETGSLLLLVSNGKSVDSSTKKKEDERLDPDPEADPVRGSVDGRDAEELVSGEEEDRVNVGSGTTATREEEAIGDEEADREKEANREPVLENGGDHRPVFASVASQPETAVNPVDLDMFTDIINASNSIVSNPEASANAVESMNLEMVPDEQKASIPVGSDINPEEMINSAILADKENIFIPVVSDTEIAMSPEALIHSEMVADQQKASTPVMLETEVTINPQEPMADIEKASTPAALDADIPISPKAVIDLEMVANEADALIPTMLEAKIAMNSEEVLNLQITSHEEKASSDVKEKSMQFDYEDKAEESNHLPWENGIYQEQSVVYVESNVETSVNSDSMNHPEKVEVEQDNACSDVKAEMFQTCNESEDRPRERAELHRENGQGDPLNLIESKENARLPEERLEVCEEDTRGNSRFGNSQFHLNEDTLGGTDDKREVEFNSSIEPRDDQGSKITVTELNHQKDSESGDEVEEIPATMDTASQVNSSSIVDDIDKQEHKSIDMEDDQQAELKREAEDDDGQGLEAAASAAAADIDQNLEPESGSLEEKQNNSAELGSAVEPRFDPEISVTALNQGKDSESSDVVEDITSIAETDDQVSLSAAIDDEDRQDCEGVHTEVDQQAESTSIAEKDDGQRFETAAADISRYLEHESGRLEVKQKTDTNFDLAIHPSYDQGSESSDEVEENPAITRSDNHVNLPTIVDDERQTCESADIKSNQLGESKSASEEDDSQGLEVSADATDQCLQLESSSLEQKRNTEVVTTEANGQTDRKEQLEHPPEPTAINCQRPQETSLEPSQEKVNERSESFAHLEEEQENRNIIVEVKEQELLSDIKELQQEHVGTESILDERAETDPVKEGGEEQKHMLKPGDASHVSPVDVSANGGDEFEGHLRMSSISPRKGCSTVIVNNVAVEPDPSADNIFIQFGSITQDELFGKSIDPIVSEREKFYIIRVPNFANDIWTEIQKTQKDVTEKTKLRDTINIKVQKQKAICTICRENLRSATENLKTAREDLQAAQSKVLLVQNTTAMKDIDDKIKGLEFKLHHETMTLKEEKQCIHELKLLGQQRERLSSSVGPEKEDLSDEQLVGLARELDSLKADFVRAEEEVKAARLKYENEEKLLKILKAEQTDANATRQKAYEQLSDLRTKSREKSSYYRMYKDDQKAAYDYVSSRNIEGLRFHCTQQVERFMNLWNNNDEFRKKYVESTKNSTLRRFKTLEEIPSALAEEPTVISEISKEISLPAAEVSPPVIPVASETKSEVPKPKDPFPALQAAETSQPAKQRKSTKAATKEAMETNKVAFSVSDHVEDTEDISRQTQKKEEFARKAEESARKEDELKKEKAAAELKEKQRLEQKIKAKEAEERKKRLAEKAKAKADYRAQKEAELREKKKAKKENKKVLTAFDTVQAGAELVSASTTSKDLPETSQELEAPVEMCSKRSSRPVATVKQYNRIQPVPLPLRNRGRRKTSTWVLVVSTILALGILFLLGNYIPFPSFIFP